MTFYRTAAAAQAAGYRACRRCLPDATPGLPGVGRRGRRRVPCDAAGRRRRRGARGRRRARAGARLLHASAQPRGHPAVRRRPAGPRPVPSCPDRAGADRDHRPHLRRRGLRRRLPQRPPVQRHDPRGLRRQPDRPPQQGRQATPARHLGHHPHPDRRPRAVRGRRPAPLPRGARHRRRRGLRTRLVRARAAPAPRPGSGPRRAGGPAARLRRVPVHPGRRARPRARHRAHPPVARRRRRSGHGRPGSVRGPVAGAAGRRVCRGCASRATSTVPTSPCRPCSASR